MQRPHTRPHQRRPWSEARARTERPWLCSGMGHTSSTHKRTLEHHVAESQDVMTVVVVVVQKEVPAAGVGGGQEGRGGACKFRLSY